MGCGSSSISSKWAGKNDTNSEKSCVHQRRDVVAMDVQEAIGNRRSIRSFRDEPVEDNLLKKLLNAATLAPSGKNAQPWRFVVLKGDKKDKLADILKERVKRLKAEGRSVGSAENSAEIMREAPVLIVVFNARWTPDEDPTGIDRYLWSVDLQSIGASIQNVLLTAESMGLSTLWICDVFFAEPQIRRWLERNEELVAAVAIGYSKENPDARPRLSVDEVTEWR